jgi:hypothetical protein
MTSPARLTVSPLQIAMPQEGHMIVRHVCGTGAAALLTVTMAASAQTTQPTPSSAEVKSDSQSGSTITLVGCIQRESDYRRANDSGRGGVAATGVGLGNEFVLVNASAAGTGSTTNATADCSAATGGEAYELTGKGEGDLEQYVGQRVELSGMLKHADANAPVGTSGTTSAQPSGGFDPLRQDLRLQEVEISTVKAYAAAPAAAPAPAVAEPAPEAAAPAPEQPQQPQRPDTAGSPQAELPRTASPVPIAGLAGLLSMCGAAGLRAYRRRK